MYWYEAKGEDDSLVLSTRVRFARNLENTPFPDHLSEAGRKKVFNSVAEAFCEDNLMVVPFDGLDAVEKGAYVDTHLASRRLAEARDGAGLLLSRDGALSVMINEEDHLRIQVIERGKQVREAFDKAVAWAKKAEEKLPIAYRARLGYLTACPTNLGSAMRVSVLIHLPALTAAGAMPPLVSALGNAGFAVRGFFGEGSRESGDLYQISNQMSREMAPATIIDAFDVALTHIEEEETKARRALLSRDRIFWEDRVMRAIGKMRYARKISYDEFIRLYSSIRFGKEAGVAEAVRIDGLDRLLIELMPASMILRDRTLSRAPERDVRRSEILRDAIKQSEQ